MHELREKVQRVLSFVFNVSTGRYGLAVFSLALGALMVEWRIMAQWFDNGIWIQALSTGILWLSQFAVLAQIIALIKSLGVPGEDDRWTLSIFGRGVTRTVGPEQLIVALTAGSTLEWSTFLGVLVFSINGFFAHTDLIWMLVAFVVYVLVSCLTNLLIALSMVRRQP